MFLFWKVYYNTLAFYLRTAFTVMTMSREKYAVKARTVEKYFLAWATFELRKLFPQTTAWVVQSAESVTHGSASSATLALTNIDFLWETKEWREPREHDICLFCKRCRSHWVGATILTLYPLSYQFKFSPIWSCVSLPRATTSSGWKLLTFV